MAKIALRRNILSMLRQQFVLFVNALRILETKKKSQNAFSARKRVDTRYFNMF